MKKILVVDNDRILLNLMRRLLEKEGFQVETAQNGIEAIDIIMTYTPDIMFVDLIMPSIDGGRLCKIIRNIDRLKDVKIIILSAAVAEEGIDPKQLLAVVTDAARHPRNVRFGECRIRIAAVDHEHFGFQGDADGDVAVGTIDGAENGPYFVAVRQIDDFVSRCAPTCCTGDVQLDAAGCG